MEYLYNVGLGFYFAKAHALLNIFVKGYNVSKDYRIWKDAASIASKNIGRKSDKSLNNKKLCHYAWLTLNKCLPLIIKQITDLRSAKPMVQF